MGLLRPVRGPRLFALVALVLLPRGALAGGCVAPPRLTSAELRDELKNQEDFPVGTILKYICRPGYTQLPGESPTLSCESNLKWLPVKELCQRKSCGHPGDLESGSVNITDLLFGSEVRFSCEEGHRLVGSESSQCVINGQSVSWSREIPFCEKIPCSPPPEIINGMHSGDPNTRYTYGSSVTYSCNTLPNGAHPLSLIGKASIYCTSDTNKNGVWSGDAPMCKVVKCNNAEVENGKKLSGFGPSYTYQNAIWFACESGYHLVGSDVIKCQANNSWAPAIPTCEKTTPNVCSAPVLPNGKLFASKLQYAFEDAVTLTCRENYSFPNGAESMTVVCRGDNMWNPPVQTCQATPNVCSAPVLPNGKLFASKLQYAFEDAVTLTCRENYSFPNGAESMTVVCRGDNMWNPPVQTCQGTPDDEILFIRNGRIKSGEKSSYSFGDIVTIECNTGYTLHGEPKIQYMGRNKWEPKIPICKLSVYIIILIVIAILAGLLGGFCIYKKYFSQKGSYQTHENGKAAYILNTEVPDENEASA